jgi:hypothetical protein
MKKVYLVFLLSVFFAPQAFATLDLMHNGNFAAATPTPPASGIPNWVTSTSATQLKPDGVTRVGVPYSSPIINSVSGPTPPPSGGPVAAVGLVGAVGLTTNGYAGTFSMLQNVYVPPDALGNTIMLYYQWVSDQCLQSFDYAEGHVQGITLFHEEPTTYPQVDPTPGWRQVTSFLPLASYRNTTITVEFVTHSDSQAFQANYLYVDDVALWCTTATKTATPTFTMTSTITPTCTISPTNTKTPTITPTLTVTPTITQTTTSTPWVVKGGETTVYPNPAQGNKVYFLYSPAALSNVGINVYNLAGLKVAHLEDNNKPGTANQITTWNITNVAPGVYLYQVTLVDVNGISTTTAMKKLVITK